MIICSRFTTPRTSEKLQERKVPIGKIKISWLWCACAFTYLSCHWQHSTSHVRVEIHLGGLGKHSHVEAHTPTLHGRRQMKYNSSPPGGGMKEWLVSANQAGHFPVSLPTLSCDHLTAQLVLQVLNPLSKWFVIKVVHVTYTAEEEGKINPNITTPYEKQHGRH